MEGLLHYVWRHRLFPWESLYTTDGQLVEVIDVGLPNTDAGPDFFNAKIRIGKVCWAGNVEIHQKASDWFRHAHHLDSHYNNTVLHVVEHNDGAALTLSGRRLPQLCLKIPQAVKTNYDELIQNDAHPPCVDVIREMPTLKQHFWLEALTAERLEQKASHIQALLQVHEMDWEYVFFILLARSFGFGVNADAFEAWAQTIRLTAVGKHRDHLFQVESYFLGQAGFFEPDAVPKPQQDEAYLAWQKEYAFLRHKFTLTPLPFSRWRFLRLRPQNFPTLRISQLAALYHSQQLDFSKMLAVQSVDEARQLLVCCATSYWDTHYVFGKPTKSLPKRLPTGAADVVLINAAVPMLFAYGQARQRPELCQKSLDLLEALPPERNSVMRYWEAAQLRPRHAGESQALLQLRQHYCDRKDCLRCRFGTAYLQRGTSASAPTPSF